MRVNPWELTIYVVGNLLAILGVMLLLGAPVALFILGQNIVAWGTLAFYALVLGVGFFGYYVPDKADEWNKRHGVKR